MKRITYSDGELVISDKETGKRVFSFRPESKNYTKAEMRANLTTAEKYLLEFTDECITIREREILKNVINIAGSFFYFHYPVVLDKISIKEYNENTLCPNGWNRYNVGELLVFIPRNFQYINFESSTHQLYSSFPKTQYLMANGLIAHYPNYSAYWKGQIKPFFKGAFYLDIAAEGWVELGEYCNTYKNINHAPFEFQLIDTDNS